MHIIGPEATVWLEIWFKMQGDYDNEGDWNKNKAMNVAMTLTNGCDRYRIAQPFSLLIKVHLRPQATTQSEALLNSSLTESSV